MRLYFLILYVSLCFYSCGQGVNDSNHSKKIVTDDRIFDTMVSEVCDCTTQTIRADKIVNNIDSCFRSSLQRHFDQLHIDTSTVNGKLLLRNELSNKFWANNFRINCPVINSLLMRATEDPTSKFFHGTLIRQEKLGVQKYQITVSEFESGTVMQFISLTPIKADLIRIASSGPNVIVDYKLKSVDGDKFPATNIWVIQKNKSL